MNFHHPEHVINLPSLFPAYYSSREQESGIGFLIGGLVFIRKIPSETKPLGIISCFIAILLTKNHIHEFHNVADIHFAVAIHVIGIIRC